MSKTHNPERFLEAQENTWQRALFEIEQGRKQSHWMWFIFPQVSGLGQSQTSRFYAIRSLEEAAAYLAHPVLGPRLIEISYALLQIEGKPAREIFGSPDDLKLRSCMTLFATVENADPVFEKVLEKYFQGKPDAETLNIINSL